VNGGLVAGLAALGGSLVGGAGATGGAGWFELRAERRAGKAAGRVVYRELVHNGQALSLFRKTEGEWISEPRDRAWEQNGVMLSRILDDDEWHTVVAGYSIMGYWRGLSHGSDATDVLDETRDDIREAMAVLGRYAGVSSAEVRERHARAEASRTETD
jgi:hypothetical protein